MIDCCEGVLCEAKEFAFKETDEKWKEERRSRGMMTSPLCNQTGQLKRSFPQRVDRHLHPAGISILAELAKSLSSSRSLTSLAAEYGDGTAEGARLAYDLWGLADLLLEIPVEVINPHWVADPHLRS